MKIRADFVTEGGSSINFYWIGNSGYLSDPTHWSLESGGVSGSTIPDETTNVVFDENSFTELDQEVDIDIMASMKSMTWENVTYNPSLICTSGGIISFGDVTFSPDMTITSPSGSPFPIFLLGESHLTSAGLTLPIIIGGTGLFLYAFGTIDELPATSAGSLYLEDDLTCQALISVNGLNTQQHSIDTQIMVMMPLSSEYVVSDISDSEISTSVFVFLDLMQIPMVQEFFNANASDFPLIPSGATFEGDFTTMNYDASNFLADIELIDWPSGFPPILFMVSGNNVLLNSVTISTPDIFIITPKFDDFQEKLRVNHFYDDPNTPQIMDGGSNFNGFFGENEFFASELTDWYIVSETGTISISDTTLYNSKAMGGATFNALLSDGNIDGGNNSGWKFKRGRKQINIIKYNNGG